MACECLSPLALLRMHILLGLPIQSALASASLASARGMPPGSCRWVGLVGFSFEGFEVGIVVMCGLLRAAGAWAEGNKLCKGNEQGT